jgi:hypothetical protein
MASYPKAEEIMKGSVTALKRKIRELGPIAPKDRNELLSLIRIMTAEVLKLKQIQPPIHTNRELVDLFLARLTVDFAGIIANKLSVQRLIIQARDNTAARNTEDMYDIEDVMEIAKETSLEYANPFGKYLGTFSDVTSEASIKLEEAVARLKDTINLQTQHNKQIDQRLATMQSFMNQPRAQAAQPGFNRGLVPSPQAFAAAAAYVLKCFYCQGPHRVAECEFALKHLDLGWIIRLNGHLRLPDSQHIPRDGVKTMKEVVENMQKPKAGIIPMSKIDKTALYQESVPTSSYVQSQSPEDENMRALTELIQKIGIDKVHMLLNTQDQSQEIIEDEESEWSQNFNLAR